MVWITVPGVTSQQMLRAPWLGTVTLMTASALTPDAVAKAPFPGGAFDARLVTACEKHAMASPLGTLAST
jgi:hypothetical protein